MDRLKIFTNGIKSIFFRLSRGSRQGRPSSPLLFALAIEPLSIFLRFSFIFQLNLSYEVKLSLYADDLCLKSCSLHIINFICFSEIWFILRLQRDLGINATRTLNALFAVNFLPLMSKIKQDLQRLGSVHLLLIRIISAVKNEHFTQIPLPFFLQKNFFKTTDQTILDFLW